ncbi:MAG: SET domain-containing protein [Myxococcales bacterium]|nr:SET domain-containing protein [Myxococcales bacterium]
MQTIRIDGTTAEHHGVRIISSRRVDGLAIEALRAVEVGERIYLSRAVLLPKSALVILETPFGERRLNPANHGFVIQPTMLRRFAKPLVARFAELYGIEASDPVRLAQAITGNGVRSWAVSSFGELTNHADHPNAAPAFTQMERAENGLDLPFVATRPIQSGDEVTISYRAFVPLLRLPDGWSF